MSRNFTIVSFLVLILSGLFEDKLFLVYSGVAIAVLLAVFSIVKSQNKFDRNAAILILSFCAIKILIKVLIQITGGA